MISTMIIMMLGDGAIVQHHDYQCDDMVTLSAMANQVTKS